MPWAKDKPKEWIRDYNRKEMQKWRANRTPNQIANENRVSREAHLKLKREVIRHYSNGTDSCSDPYRLHLPNCPFLTMIEVLTIDHIRGGGSKHQKEIGIGRLYQWLKNNNYPEGYQVLCIGCQWVKRRRNNELTQPQP